MGASLVRHSRSRVAVAMNSCASPMRSVDLSQGVATQIFDSGLSCSFSERSPQLDQHRPHQQRRCQCMPRQSWLPPLFAPHRLLQSLYQLWKRLQLQ